LSDAEPRKLAAYINTTVRVVFEEDSELDPRDVAQQELASAFFGSDLEMVDSDQPSEIWICDPADEGRDDRPFKPEDNQ